ncbi:hypothetical protein BGZ51_000457 [Haplosporangium sp. Z 767]|nr:hypothetical protein BGZ51_000457 [Haplosporangium sp. Z 767]
MRLITISLDACALSVLSTAQTLKPSRPADSEPIVIKAETVDAAMEVQNDIISIENLKKLDTSIFPSAK